MNRKIALSKSYQIASETKKRLSHACLGFPIEELSPLDILKVVETYFEAQKVLEEKKQRQSLHKKNNHGFHNRNRLHLVKK